MRYRQSSGGEGGEEMMENVPLLPRNFSVSWK